MRRVALLSGICNAAQRGNLQLPTVIAGLSGNCIAVWNIAGFAIRHSILESKYVAFGNFTLLFSIL
jgi:hypothetical protein